MADATRTMTTKDAHRLPAPAFILLILMIVFSMLAAWKYAKKAPAIDFYQFWVVGKFAAGGAVTNPYSDEFREKIGAQALADARERQASDSQILAAENRNKLETFSTPFLYSIFSVFGRYPYDASLRIFTVLSILAILFSAAIICYVSRYSVNHAAIVILFVFACSEPLLSELRVGNVNAFQLGMVGIYLSIVLWIKGKGRYFLAGMALGFLAMFKPNTAFSVFLLIVFWFATGNVRKLLIQLGGIAAASLAAFAVSSWLFGTTACWLYWFTAATAIPADICTINMGNMATARLISDFTGANVPMMMIVIYNAIAIWSFRMRRREMDTASISARAPFDEARDDLKVIASGLLVYLLSAPLVWLHYFLLALPAMLLILQRGAANLSKSGVIKIMSWGLALVIFFSLSINPLRILFQLNLKIHLVVITSICANLAFLLLLLEPPKKTDGNA